MKKFYLLLTVLTVAASLYALPRAFYVKVSNTYHKYSFGVASDITFSEGGKKMNISGYDEVINLDDVDEISFDAPIMENTLTPDEQKERMIQIGEEFNKSVDLNRIDELIRMVAVFSENYYDNSGKWHKASCEYNLPDEYVPDHYKAIGKLFDEIKYAGKIAGGDFAIIREVAKSAVGIFRASDLFGVFEADEEKNVWNKISDADFFEMRFLTQDNVTWYSVRMDCSSGYTVWKHNNMELRLPNRVEVDMKKGSESIGSIIMTCRLVQDESISISATVTGDGYVVSADNIIKNEGISDYIKVTLDGKTLVENTVEVKGKNLLNFDEMLMDADEATSYRPRYGNYHKADSNPLLSHFLSAEFKIDIIGQLQVEGKVCRFNEVYQSLNTDTLLKPEIDKDGYILWSYGLGKFVSYSDGIAYTKIYDDDLIDDMTLDLANYSDIKFYYDDKREIQGYLTWEPGETIEEDYPYCNKSNALLVVDGFLTNVHRDYDWDTDEYSGWYYMKETPRVDDYTDQEVVKIPVDESALITPTVVRMSMSRPMPCIVFPDQTSFVLWDFFNEESFKSLIDEYYKAVDVYESITRLR
ncbi:MAG: hypothetical protein K2K64_00225 [Muribaculaceae bacterium]|nr:hypothetical protein [Muribaculaceae bacterium]